MLIARTSFVAEYDGERIEVTAGQTVVDRDHDLAQRFPEHFEDQVARTNGQHDVSVRGRSSAHTRSPALEPGR